jgi:HAD superfamily hydrolase (TIGR01509 family)
MGCIIFDLDGTLINSEPACNQAFFDLIPGLPGTIDELIKINRGRKLTDIMADIEIKIGDKLPLGFESAYRARVADLFESQLVAMPGAKEVLSDLQCSVCVASNAPASKIAHALGLTGLTEFFVGRIYSAYDVGFWKPDPRLFLHAAKDMGFSPDDCVVVEDSSAGIDAANNAGMRTVQYLPKEDEACLSGAKVIRDLRELTELDLWQ